MRIVWLVTALVLATGAVNAQNIGIGSPIPPYAAPDAELWSLMVKALDDTPMSMSAHQAVQQIMTNVQREAQAREARAKAEAAARAPGSTPPPNN